MHWEWWLGGGLTYPHYVSHTHTSPPPGLYSPSRRGRRCIRLRGGHLYLTISCHLSLLLVPPPPLMRIDDSNDRLHTLECLNVLVAMPKFSSSQRTEQGIGREGGVHTARASWSLHFVLRGGFLACAFQSSVFPAGAFGLGGAGAGAGGAVAAG